MEVLKDLWYGNLYPQEEYSVNQQEIKRTLSNVVELEEKLKRECPLDLRASLDKFIEEQMDLSALTECAGFVKGFCLGARMMIAVFKRDF